MHKLINDLYYFLKPVIPRRIQLGLRRLIMKKKRNAFTSIWPILEKAGEKPTYWKSWPNNYQFTFILTHDVEFAGGQEKCLKLMKLEKSLGFRSSFNFVPLRYKVSELVRKELDQNGFEVGVHGLYHDGKLFKSKSEFQKRASEINKYLKSWNAVGFRAPAMHHNLEWIHDLNIKYDLSTFDTDPFEPQSDGVETIFPYFVQNMKSEKGYLEIPYTLPQDHCVFIILREKNTKVWEEKLDWIVAKGGMALLNTHPDYMNFEDKQTLEEFPIKYYKQFLIYVRDNYHGKYWHALPRELTEYYNNTYR